MRKGASFCARPLSARTAVLREWNVSLEAALRYHRSDNSFEQLRDALRSVCTNSPDGTRSLEIQAPTRAFIEEQLWQPHDPETCLPDMSPLTLIDSIGNDTALLASLARLSLRPDVPWFYDPHDRRIPIRRCAANAMAGDGPDGWRKILTTPLSADARVMLLATSDTVTSHSPYRLACPSHP